MAKRDAAERKRNPSVVRHDAPMVCARCAPLLANEQKFHAEAFAALAKSLDDVLGRLDDAYREVRELRARLRDAGHDCKALLAEYLTEYEKSAPFEACDEDMLLDYFRRAYELGQRRKESVPSTVTP